MYNILDMTRLKAPLLGLQASGTIGDVLTLRRRNRTTIAETKPIPLDRKTLLQLYQRWRYQDAMIYWATLTTAQKAVYKALGNRTNNTTIGAFLEEYLPAPFNQTLYMPFNEGFGITTLDLSPNAWTATLHGLTWQTGYKNACLKGDGINDYLDLGRPPAIYTPNGTIEMIFKLPALPAAARWFISSDLPGFNPGEFQCYASAIPRINWAVTRLGAEAWSISDAPVTADTWHHLLLLWGTQGVLICLDGVDQVIRDPDTSPIGPTNPTYLFCRFPTFSHNNGYIDELHFYDKDLSPTERVARAAAYGFP